MENNALQVFDFQEKHVRLVTVNDEPWFVAKDVIDGLGYSESSNTARLIQAVPDEWKGVKPIHTLGGVQNMSCLAEQGLYFFLARSDKPAALPFQRKVAGEIIPSIRKHGAYLTPQKIEEVLLNPDTIIQLATALKEERNKTSKLEVEAALNHPQLLFANSVMASEGSILIGDLAKIIRQNGVNIGQNRLFEWLRKNDYLMKKGSSRNMPTQSAMDAGLFRVLERTIDNPDGSIRVTKTTKVTGKGQVFFVNLFLGEGAELCPQ